MSSSPAWPPAPERAQHHAACLARTVYEVIGEAVKDEVMLKVAGSVPDDIDELMTASAG